MRSLNVISELILNIFGLTWSKRRVNYIFKSQDINESSVNKLKSNLDNKSIRIIDALLYLANNKYKKIYKAKDVALYCKFYNMNWMHKLYYRLKYNIPANLVVLQEVFHHKCGLQFVSTKELAYLKGKSSITAGAYWGDSALVLNTITKNKVYGF